MLVAGRRGKLAVLAAGAATVLAGCGLHPGAAAVVGSETITHEQVDDVAVAVCSANVASAEAAGQPLPPVTNRKVRELAIRILIETELAQQFGEQEGVEPNAQQVSQLVAQNDQGISGLPEDQQQSLRTAVRESVEGQLMLIEIGRESLGDVSEGEALDEGTRLVTEYANSIDVEVDPRYGRFEEGAFQRGGTDLSVAASDRAVEGDKEDPGRNFIGSLPAAQQCG